VCKNHGYIVGEEFTCPECGEKTEVYSRITGYYRPVQNWNDGKAQEYKERKVYNIETSVLTKKAAVDAITDAVAACAPATADGVYLFTTATCPNCKIACGILDKQGATYQKLLADENVDLVEQFGVKQAPTLVVVKNGVVEKYAGVSNIKKYLNV